jgi:hypothetical protein
MSTIKHRGKMYRRLDDDAPAQKGDLYVAKEMSYYREVQPEAKPETPAPIEDGGPAFPLQDWDECIHSRRTETGMTLRDWFAGQALVALPHIGCGADLTPTELALSAYQMADAMLKARKEVLP